MKLSIIVPDNRVIIDTEGYEVDLSSLGPTIHAIQWNSETGKGHIEFVDEDPNDGQCPANQTIDNIEPYQAIIDAWSVSKVAAAEEVQRQTALSQQNLPNKGMNVIA